MASRAFHPQPLDVLLSAIPSLPRSVLDRLVARMIDHMDEMDPDPDLEPDDEDHGVDDMGEDDRESAAEADGEWYIDQRHLIHAYNHVGQVVNTMH